jgi:hypothetical protein
MNEHTKEPWPYYRINPETATASFNQPYSPIIVGAGPRFVTGDKGAIIGIHADDYRRIAACVNACAGLPTEILEKLVASGHTLQIGFGQALHAHLSSPQPTIQEPRTNLPKPAFDPYDTIEQQDFIQKGK